VSEWTVETHFHTWKNTGVFYFCPLDISGFTYDHDLGLEGWNLVVAIRLWKRVFKFEHARYRSIPKEVRV